MSTPAPVQTKRTTRSGIDLNTFDDVKLFKLVPTVAEVADINDALGRLGNDHKKLLSIIRDGLQAEAIKAAYEANDGWLKVGEDGKDTTETYDAANLVSSDILNPVVLGLARINPVEVKRGDSLVEITWDDAKNAEEKRAVKDATLDMIRSTPRIVDGLKKKMAAAQAAGETTNS